MKTAATILFLLVSCIGCSTMQLVSERFGPGPDSAEFLGELDAAVAPNREAISILATWYPKSHGYNIADVTGQEATGVLAVTQENVIFFNWRFDQLNYIFEYVPEKTISREDLIEVVAKAQGRSRLLVLVTEDDLNTFELVRDGGLLVDVESTDKIAAVLADSLIR